MPQSGRVVFSRMDEVQFGKPASEVIPQLVRQFDAQRIFLMVSGTLNRQTDEVEKLRQALGNRCVGTFDKMPPHTPRAAVIAAAEQAREAKADLIVTLGGGSITDGAKAVQLCLANDVRDAASLDRLRAPAPVKPPAPKSPSPARGRRSCADCAGPRVCPWPGRQCARSVPCRYSPRPGFGACPVRG